MKLFLSCTKWFNLFINASQLCRLVWMLRVCLWNAYAGNLRLFCGKLVAGMKRGLGLNVEICVYDKWDMFSVQVVRSSLIKFPKSTQLFTRQQKLINNYEAPLRDQRFIKRAICCLSCKSNYHLKSHFVILLTLSIIKLSIFIFISIDFQ